MQISEELIKQITNAVMTEMQRRSEDPCVSSSDCASTAASARKWNHHSPGSLCRPFHRIRIHIHNNLRKKLHVVFLRRSKLDTEQLHPGLPDLMRGSIGKRMNPDLPSLRVVFNLVQQLRNILVVP